VIQSQMTAKKWSFTSHDALGRGVASTVAKLHNCKLYGNSTDFRTSKIVIEARGLALISVLLRLAGGDGRGWLMNCTVIKV
jgi:hypothetical protein